MFIFGNFPLCVFLFFLFSFQHLRLEGKLRVECVCKNSMIFLSVYARMYEYKKIYTLNYLYPNRLEIYVN